MCDGGYCGALCTQRRTQQQPVSTVLGKLFNKAIQKYMRDTKHSEFRQGHATRSPLWSTQALVYLRVFIHYNLVVTSKLKNY